MKNLLFVLIGLLFVSGCTVQPQTISQSYDAPKLYSTVDISLVNKDSSFNITCYDFENITGEIQRMVVGDAVYYPNYKDEKNTEISVGHVIEYRRTFIPETRVMLNFNYDFKDKFNVTEWEARCKINDNWIFNYTYTDSSGYEKEGKFSCNLYSFDVNCFKEDIWKCKLYKDRYSQKEYYDLEVELKECMFRQTENIGMR